MCVLLVCPVLAPLFAHPQSLTGPLHPGQSRAALWHPGSVGMQALPSHGELALTWDVPDLASDFLKTTRMLTLLFSSSLTSILLCEALQTWQWCDPSAASQGIFHMGALLTVNVSTLLLSSPKNHSHQGVWQFLDASVRCQSISRATFLTQYSGDLVPWSWGIWWSNDKWVLKFGSFPPTIL